MKGRIRAEDIEEVRARANIIDIAAEYMQVRKSGSARFVALCPFHQEKTPSFSISADKGFYKCFGCDKSGDVFTLVEELENLTFVEAVERLAAKVGVDLTYEQISPAQRDVSSKKMRLIAAHREAVAFYHDRLMSAADGRAARDYVKKRGLTKETVEAFTLGWAPGPPHWDELSKHLSRKRFTESELIEAGLAQRGERGIRDRFLGRVMFPTFDISGEPVGFGGRVLDDSTPKYLNSAETPIFHKGRVMYGLNWAKKSIAASGRTVVVEGYMDVIALHQAGVTEVVATNGTSLSADHFNLLARFASLVVVAFDSDRAGATAVERAFDAALASTLDVRVLIVPEGKDPADFVAARGGEDFRVLAAAAPPMVEFRLRREIARFDLGDPDGRARAVRACIPIVAQIKDDVLRKDYTGSLADWTNTDPNVVFLEVGRALGDRSSRSAPQVRRTSAQVRLERDLLKVALQYPKAIDEHAPSVLVELFSVPAHRAIWEEVLAGGDAGQITGRLTEEGTRETVRALTLEKIEVELGTDGLPPAGYVAEIANRMKDFSLRRLIDSKKRYLQRLNPIENEQEYKALYAELIALEGERQRMSDEPPEAGVA